ncbi:Transcriptional regulator, MarR family [Streptococcus sp. DD10]|uniref:MarR family winged helix-turn-helix transcriptional regulator n=1 Tax=Streptococcus sp. DD10 TaxID=1777878 RepID=UPI000794E094|nr:MarR family transcriptional regulator [Streptococcus sp. DD10]KXT74157.1 Transcriptional regulator, MarR family [Streptococcus sp. DD10]
MKKIQKQLNDHRLDLKTAIVLNKAIRSFRPYEAIAPKQFGLTLSQFSVLETLYTKGEMRVQDLINTMLSTSGNMTVILRNMESSGWIQRTISPQDRRSFLLSLTDEGTKKIEAILPHHIHIISETLSILSKEDKQELIRILKQFKNL